MKDWKSIFNSPFIQNHVLNKTFLALLFAIGALCACSHTPLIGDDPKSQRYVDVTKKSLPPLPGVHRQAAVAQLNRDGRKDLLVLSRMKDGGQKLLVLINASQEKFAVKSNEVLDREIDKNTRFFSAGDFNGDRIHDLLAVSGSKAKPEARIFLNNQKGYFYVEEKSPPLPALIPGVERVDPVDIDQDGDVDLFFTGKKLMDSKGETRERQIQLMINDGQAKFEEASLILTPPLRPGIVAPIFADYDGDAALDVFLVYEQGGNVLLINNGLGKLDEAPPGALPNIQGRHSHADWADFDEDEDNDLLVVALEMEEKYQDHPREYSYILENVGRGRFKKKSLRAFPTLPTEKIYMLDADGNDTVDIFFLTRKGAYFFSGLGSWSFSQETRKRLPYFTTLKGVSFGDINGDGSLDIFAIPTKNQKVRLWVSTFD